MYIETRGDQVRGMIEARDGMEKRGAEPIMELGRLSVWRDLRPYVADMDERILAAVTDAHFTDGWDEPARPIWLTVPPMDSVERNPAEA